MILALSEAAWFAFAAGIVSVVTLVVSTIMQSRTLTRAADAQRVTDLEKDLDRAHDEIDDLERRVSECEAGRTELKREVERLNAREIDLMRRLLRLEGGSAT